MDYQKWFNVELKPISADLFRDFLRKNSIRFETSGSYNLVHFEIFIRDVNDYILCKSFLTFLP